MTEPMLETHELADYWPTMPGEDFDELIEDIRKNGLRDPIVLYESKVLDGRHRYRAAISAGVDPEFIPYEGDDPAGFVISKNARRRHSTKIEVAEAVARCRAWIPATGSLAEAPEGAMSNEQIAEEAQVSVRTVQRAKERIRREQEDPPPPEPEMEEDEEPIPDEPKKDPLVERLLRIQVLETENAELRESIFDLEEKIEFFEAQQSDESAMRYEKLNNQRAEINQLKGRVSELSAKIQDERYEKNRWKQKYTDLQSGVYAYGEGEPIE